MTIITQDRVAFSKPFQTVQTEAAHLSPEFVVVGLLSLLGLSVSALAFASGITVDFEPIAAFLG